MSEFDKWFKEQERVLYKDEKWIAKKAWDARQAKIDELQARVDEAMKYIEPSDELSHKAYRDLVKILKGNKDEN